MAPTAQVIPFRRPTDSFDPETLQTLGSAYDLVMAGIRGSANLQAISRIVAGRIMDAAQRGERDIETLRTIALTGI